MAKGVHKSLFGRDELIEEGALARFDCGVATHVGRRPNNEDAYRLAPELGLYAVADGLGGYQGGEIASNVAVATVAELIASRRREMDRHPPSDSSERVTLWERLLVEAVRLAHQQIVARQVGQLEMMGSTFAAILIPDGTAIVCHVGDSRVYLLRDGELKPLTRDHSLYAEMLVRGVEPAEDQPAIYANELTRALGIEGNAEPDVARVPIRTGDLFLLCTDGLYESLREEEMVRALEAPSAQEACDRLVHRAYEQGGVDNMTALVVRVVGE
jgi:serine/threonine protein phosphatase PrpC